MSELTAEMLWEDQDADDVLNSRFGFTTRADAARWVVDVVTNHYGLADVECQRIVISASNALAWLTTADASVIAKWSIAAKKFPRLSAITELTSWLADQGIPVASPFPTLSGDRHVGIDGTFLALQPVISGDHVDVAKSEEVREAGRALAQICLALRRYPRAGSLPELASWPPPAELISWWLRDVPKHLSADSVAVLRSLVTRLPELAVDAQLVHGDFRAANVLVHNGKVTGILDLEEIRRDSVIDELARSAVLIGTLFRDWGPVSEAVHEQFRVGFESVVPLSDAERAWFKPLTLWWTLVMTPEDDRTGWGAAAQRLAESLSA